jgi:major histocompatibility complex class I
MKVLERGKGRRDGIIIISRDKGKYSWAVVEHAFNPSTWEAEAGEFLSSRPVWSTK